MRCVRALRVQKGGGCERVWLASQGCVAQQEEFYIPPPFPPRFPLVELFLVVSCHVSAGRLFKRQYDGVTWR